MSDSNGFTLLELLVVLILIGLLSGMVFVSISGGILRSQERRFVLSFQHALVRARAAALARGKLVRFLIDSNKRAYSIDGKGWEEIPETIQVEGEGVAEISEGVYGVIFYPDGSTSGGEIDLKWQKGQIDRITVDRLLGIIKIKHLA